MIYHIVRCIVLNVISSVLHDLLYDKDYMHFTIFIVLNVILYCIIYIVCLWMLNGGINVMEQTLLNYITYTRFIAVHTHTSLQYNSQQIHSTLISQLGPGSNFTNST